MEVCLLGLVEVYAVRFQWCFEPECDPSETQSSVMVQMKSCQTPMKHALSHHNHSSSSAVSDPLASDSGSPKLALSSRTSD